MARHSACLAGLRQLEVVLDLAYRANSPSPQSEVQRVKAANADVWMPTSYQTDAILFVKTSRELDYNPKMIMTQNAGHLSSDFVTQVGKAVQAQYSKRAGKDLYDNPARAFTGFITLMDAINRAGSTDPEAIRKALVATNIPGDQLIMTWDHIRFDEKGQKDRK